MKETSLTPAAIAALAHGDLDNFLVAATPGGIERQEAQGQQEFVKNERLPRNLNGAREALEARGVVFGNTGDDLFVDVKLPAGWQKRATSHSMWSELFDDQGKKVASIFYKAAFYDRDAFLYLEKQP